jgi:hypothetical protein
MMQTRLQKPKLGTKAKTPNPRKSADGLEGITDTYCDQKQRKKGRMATAEAEEKENARVRGRAAVCGRNKACPADHDATNINNTKEMEKERKRKGKEGVCPGTMHTRLSSRLFDRMYPLNS